MTSRDLAEYAPARIRPTRQSGLGLVVFGNQAEAEADLPLGRAQGARVDARRESVAQRPAP